MFTPITNPYIVGNPIKTKSMFYGREDDFEFIRRKLESGGRSYIIVLSGERRSGKTSILFQILNGRLGDNFIPILIDMQTMAGLKNEAEFFEKFALETIKNLDETLRQNNYDFSSKDSSPYKVFTQLLDDMHRIYPQKNKLFLIDEYELIETKSEEGSLSPNFIPFLSGILESDRHISFIFTGSKTLQERKTSFWQNLFGKSLFRNVSFLSQQDTIRLITEPVKASITYDDNVLATIYRLTSGQPFYTQIVGQNIVDFVNEHERTHITLADLNEIVNEILENPLPQMIYFWNSLPQSQMLMLALLAEILEDSETEIKPSGVIRQAKKKKLGLELDSQIVNTILESLYHKKNVSKTGNGYSFQIDLMRQWIRRDHSIWRVMKEVDVASVMQSERPTSSISQASEHIAEEASRSGLKKWLIPVSALLISVTVVAWIFLGDADRLSEPSETAPEQTTQNQENRPETSGPNITEEETNTEPPAAPPQSSSRKDRPVQKSESTPEKKSNGVPGNTGPDLAILTIKQDMLGRKAEAERSQAPLFANDLFAEAERVENEAENFMLGQEYETAGEKYDQAKRLYTEATSKSKNFLEQAASETETLRVQADAAKSKLRPEHRELGEYKDAEDLVSRAEISIQEKNFPLAQKNFREAIQLYGKAMTKRDNQSEEIRTAIREYVHAIETKDLSRASKISTKYRSELNNQWAPFFDVADDIKIDLTIKDIGFTGSSASVFVDVVMNYSGAGGAGSRNKWKFELAESGSEWFITKISEAN